MCDHCPPAGSHLPSPTPSPLAQDGAWLLPHVDRQETHALSIIMNVDQGGMREPWPLEIYDVDGTRHEVLIEPGELVYYESARCIHGRPDPMKGR